MSRSGRIRSVGVALFAAAAALAACGGPAVTVTPTAVPSGVVFVQASDYRFTPATLTVPAGVVTFSVKNAGTQEHEFEIFDASGSVVDEIEGLVPGLTKPLTVTLAPGSYVFKCLLNGHDQVGMTGTLTVR